MLEENKKIVTVSFVAAGLLVAFVFNLLLAFVAASFPMFEKIRSQDVLSNGIPVGLGLLTFAILRFRPATFDWADAVVSELKKVVWPSRIDTWRMTIVVVVMLLVSSVFVGGFDLFWSYLIKYLLTVF